MKTFFSLTTFFLFASQALSTGTYPLQIGNRWDYGTMIGPNQWSRYYTARIVDDTVMPNGHTYFVESSDKDGGQHFRYLRQDGAFVYSYAASNESVLYDFSRQDGDTISIVYTSTDTIITTLQIQTSLCFDQERQTWIYFTKSRQTSAYSFEYVADNLGYTGASGEAAWGYTLMGAIIDNTQYGIITSVPVPQPNNPRTFDFPQNYPNPFNPSTKLQVISSSSTDASLSIFNSLGQKVATLYQGRLEPGVHKFVWEAARFASGVYICRLDAGKYSRTIKLLLLK
jgi:Secretion system C-terminal sorting domain